MSPKTTTRRAKPTGTTCNGAGFRLASQPRPNQYRQNLRRRFGRFRNDRDGLERWWRRPSAARPASASIGPIPASASPPRPRPRSRASRKLAAEAAFWELSPAQKPPAGTERGLPDRRSRQGVSPLFPQWRLGRLDLRRQRGTFAAGSTSRAALSNATAWRRLAIKSAPRPEPLGRPDPTRRSACRGGRRTGRNGAGRGATAPVLRPTSRTGRPPATWRGTRKCREAVRLADRLGRPGVHGERDSGNGGHRVLLAFDRRTGRQLWRRTVLHSALRTETRVEQPCPRARPLRMANGSSPRFWMCGR